VITQDHLYLMQNWSPTLRFITERSSPQSDATSTATLMGANLFQVACFPRIHRIYTLREQKILTADPDDERLIN
jgi:hypothetical protein